MNPFFWFLVLLLAVTVWFALRKAFIWIGEKAYNLAKDTQDIMTREDTGDSEHNEGENNNA
jgi:hypothetical protein